MLGGIVERLSQPGDRRVEVGIEFDKDSVGPEAMAQLLPSDGLTRVLKKNGKYLKGLFREPDSQPELPQVAGVQVNLKIAEADNKRPWDEVWHCPVPSRLSSVVLIDNLIKSEIVLLSAGSSVRQNQYAFKELPQSNRLMMGTEGD